MKQKKPQILPLVGTEADTFAIKSPLKELKMASKVL